MPESPHPNPLPAIPSEETRLTDDEALSAKADAPRVDAALMARLAWRGIWSARLARFGLLSLAIAGFLMAKGDTLAAGMILLFATVAGWIVLVTKTARNQQDLLRVPAWIEAGQFDRADVALSRLLARFSIAVRPRLHALRHLAVSFNAQGRHGDARLIAANALTYRLPKPITDGMHLIVAEAALAANDLVGAHAALSALVPPLALRDSLKLLELQTDYCVRVSAWPHVAHDLPGKVELAELLPAENAAVVQAMLALAARRLGQTTWADWLLRRATLLADSAKLVERKPVLGELF